MRRAALSLLIVAAVATVVWADESASPHHMLKADGTADMDKCAACHQPDMSLSRSKAETCTLCHATTIHSGAAEHLAATAAGVAGKLHTADGRPALPLTEDGRIFCGTCHLFHDPAISDDKPLAHAWVPAATGLAEAVRRARAAQWNEIAQKYDQPAAGATTATKSTRALRLPVDDGSLCMQCHGGMR